MPLDAAPRLAQLEEQVRQETIQATALEASVRLLTGDQRIALAWYLGGLPDRAAISAPVLVALLADPLAEVRANAAAALVRLGKVAIDPVLTEAELHDRFVEPKVRTGKDGQTAALISDYAAWILINTAADPGPSLVALLKRHPASKADPGRRLTSERPFDAWGYARFILKMRGDRSAPLIVGMLGGKDPDLQALALGIAERLGRGASPALPTLKALVEQGGESAKYAVGAVAEIMADDAGPTLGRWLRENRHADVRAAAAEAMPASAANVEALVAALSHDSERSVRDAALSRLRSFDTIPAEAADALLPLLSEARKETRDATLQTIAHLPAGSPAFARLVPALTTLLKAVPLGDDEGMAEFGSPLTDIERAGPFGAPAFDLLVKRLGDHVANKMSWATPKLLSALAAVRPQDRVVPQAMLDSLIEETPLRTLADILQTVARLYPDQARFEQILVAQLDGGLEARLAAQRRITSSRTDIMHLADYDLYEYRDAITANLTVLATINGSSIAKLPTIIERLRGKPDLHEAFCEALKTAIDPRDEKAPMIRDRLGKAWSSACAPPAPAEMVDAAAFLKKMADQFRHNRDHRAPPDPTVISFVEDDEDDAGIETMLDGLKSHARNADEILLAALASADIPSSYAITRAVIASASTDPALAARLGALEPTLSWEKVSLLESQREDGGWGGSGLGLFVALSHSPDFARWAQGHSKRAGGLVTAILARADIGEPDRLLPGLRELLGSPTLELRHSATAYLAGNAALSTLLQPELLVCLHDKDATVASSAALALVNGAATGEDWDAASEITIKQVLRDRVATFLDQMADALRPSMLVSGRFYELPPFPWPPPRYAARAVFGQDIDAGLLGDQMATLGSVHQRLLDALRRTDPNFQSGLFAVPHGFALLTKVEQTDQQGWPLADRWSTTRAPPTTLSDYLVDLFLAPPGYYREIAFVFTDEVNFGSSDKSLPAIRGGGDTLPPDLAAIPLAQRHAYIFVYAFERRDAGTPHLYEALSAPMHLARSGLGQALRSR